MWTASAGVSSVPALRACVTAARLVALLVLTVGLAVLSAYAMHVEGPVSLKSGLQGMSPLTALALVILSLAQLAQSWQRESWAALGGCLAMGGGFSLVLVQLLEGRDTVSPLLESAVGFGPTMARVSVATAISVAALGVSMIAGSRQMAADLIALGVALISSFALLGYAYGVDQLYALPLFNTMALHTAASLLSLSVNSIFIRPSSNWCDVIGARTESGAATRRQLLFMSVPIVVGWALLRAIRFSMLGSAAAMALLVIATVASLGVLILRDGRRLLELEQERRAKLAIQQLLHAEMALQLKTQESEILERTSQQALAEASIFKAQRLEALSRLTGGIAHDFNNVLQGIGGAVELIGKRSAAGKPIDSLLEGVKSAMQRGGKLGGQLLAFSRTQKMHVRALGLDQLLVNVQPMLSAALGSHITVNYALHARGQAIFTDDAQFELALLNLALNARDAMAGRGQLTLETQMARADGSTQGTADVLLRMSDTGEGMSAAVLARAAEAFFSTKPEGTASGLGLAQVDGFMRQCQGSMNIISEPLRGTSVELRFPTEKAAVAANPAVARRNSDCNDEPSRGVIVVIEDDDVVRRVIVEGLKESGYEVAEASDGSAGVDQIRKLKPAAAVIDYLMPELTGAEVAALARAEQPDLPIVFMSGHFETAALEVFTDAMILRKPFEMTSLHATLNQVIAGSALPGFAS